MFDGIYHVTAPRAHVCAFARPYTSAARKTHIVDDGGEREEVEKIGKVLPHSRRPVNPKAFIVETINLSPQRANRRGLSLLLLRRSHASIIDAEPSR